MNSFSEPEASGWSKERGKGYVSCCPVCLLNPPVLRPDSDYGGQCCTDCIRVGEMVTSCKWSPLPDYYIEHQEHWYQVPYWFGRGGIKG